jgi:leucine dehydrogenase
MWAYDDSREALRDALRLSRAMTYKSAVADLPLGGGKGVIMTPPGVRLHAEQRTAALLDFGDVVESLAGRYITAEDVGTSSHDMRVIAQRTRHVAGLPRRVGGSGDPSPFTALGVESAIRACCERVFSSSSLRDRRVGVIGLGHVGSRVAKRCALGAVLNHETVPRLRCRIVAGAANNQLASDSVADLLVGRDILWAPDFVVNAGGIINIAEELDAYDPAAARRRVRRIGEIVLDIFDRAEAAGTTPLAAAMDLAHARLAA